MKNTISSSILLIMIISFVVGFAQSNKSNNIPLNAVLDVKEKLWVDYNPKNHRIRKYFGNGKIHSEGKIIGEKVSNNILTYKFHGTWKTWHKNGTLWRIENYINGKLNGETKQYYPNGKLHSSGYLENDKPNGKWTYWDDGGKKIFDEYFHKGRRTKIVNYNIINPSRQRPLNVHKKAMFYKENRKWVYIDNSNNYYSWYKNGEKFFVTKFINNLIHGELIQWYRNGNKMEAGHYVGGQKSGKWLYWNMDGNLNEERIYKNNKVIYRKVVNEPIRPKDLPYMANWDHKEKKWKVYNKKNEILTLYCCSGEKVGEGKFIDGRKESFWIFWYKNKIKKYEGMYEGGLKTGIWRVWNNIGELEGVFSMKKGKVINLEDHRLQNRK